MSIMHLAAWLDTSCKMHQSSLLTTVTFRGTNRAVTVAAEQTAACYSSRYFCAPLSPKEAAALPTTPPQLRY